MVNRAIANNILVIQMGRNSYQMKTERPVILKSQTVSFHNIHIPNGGLQQMSGYRQTVSTRLNGNRFYFV